MNDTARDLFGPPIYAYSDQDAIDDGVLVPISGDGAVNRVTRAVFDQFARALDNPRFFDIAPLIGAIRAMLTIPPDSDGWRIGRHEGKELWLVPNEEGGLTLMFPTDY